MSFHEKFGFWVDVIVVTSFNDSLLIMAIINGRNPCMSYGGGKESRLSPNGVCRDRTP
ncbi:MAG TPA: hypothetical protein VE944_14095 [Nostoc sp.]|nr:hypothetical protein [Nostoc sp.]HYX15470.1 hypothetical protein [Nostoc sp.]